MSLRISLGALVALALAGCSLLFANELDGARQAGPPNAGVGAEGGSGKDSGGGHPDASTVDGAVAHGCAAYVPAPKFCEDFDDPTLPIDNAWSRVDREAGDSVYDSTVFFSAPRSAKITVAATKGCQYSRFEKNFDTGRNSRLEFHFKYQPKLGRTSEFTPFVAYIENSAAASKPSCGALLYIEVDKTGAPVGAKLNVQTDAMTDDVRDIAGITPGDQWTEISFLLTPLPKGGVKYHITLAPENGTAKDTDLELTQCPSQWDNASMYVGYHCDDGQGTSYYDDVRADWE